MNKKLKVGLLCNSLKIKNWEYVMIEKILQSDFIELNLVIINDNRVNENSFFSKIINNKNNLLQILYQNLDEKIFDVKPNAFKTVELNSLITNVKIIKLSPKSTKYSDRFNKNDISKLKQYDLDVLIRMGFKILRGDILKVPKYGIWSFHHADNNVNRGGPAGFWEVIGKEKITGTTLQILSEELDGGKVLERSFSSTDFMSVNRNRNKYFWKSLSMMPRNLERLAKLGDKEFFKNIEHYNPVLSPYSNKLYRQKDISNLKMLRFFIRTVYSYFSNGLKNLFFYNQWILQFTFAEDLNHAIFRYKKIIPPKDRFFADPFIVFNKEKYYIFFEEFLFKTNKGHISLIELELNGKYSRPTKILDKSYHLSYPHIIEHDNNYYMIPESIENKTIEIYKCVSFPYKWEFYMNLMEGIMAVDSTIFYYKDTWWLFTNLIENEGGSIQDELFLFYSDDLLSNKWTSHPMNPIVSDVRNARPAGNIFIAENKIIRPAQDSSRRYGYGINLNEIITLNKNKYFEKKTNYIDPKWDDNIIGTHTINHVKGLTFIDAILKRSKLFGKIK